MGQLFGIAQDFITFFSKFDTDSMCLPSLFSSRLCIPSIQIDRQAYKRGGQHMMIIGSGVFAIGTVRYALLHNHRCHRRRRRRQQPNLRMGKEFFSNNFPSLRFCVVGTPVREIIKAPRCAQKYHWTWWRQQNRTEQQLFFLLFEESVLDSCRIVALHPWKTLSSVTTKPTIPWFFINEISRLSVCFEWTTNHTRTSLHKYTYCTVCSSAMIINLPCRTRYHNYR